jgi:hypothetical protein
LILAASASISGSNSLRLGVSRSRVSGVALNESASGGPCRFGNRRSNRRLPTFELRSPEDMQIFASGEAKICHPFGNFKAQPRCTAIRQKLCRLRGFVPFEPRRHRGTEQKEVPILTSYRGAASRRQSCPRSFGCVFALRKLIFLRTFSTDESRYGTE